MTAVQVRATAEEVVGCGQSLHNLSVEATGLAEGLNTGNDKREREGSRMMPRSA